MKLLCSLALMFWVSAPGPRRTPVVEVVERAGPAVVNINAEIVEADNPFRRGRPRDDFWAPFLPPSGGPQKTQSLGSGVIIDKSGVVLTNEHVIAHASAITVVLQDRRVFAADVAGADPTFDVAVLKLRNANNLPEVEPYGADDLMIGEPAIAIGNPFGLTNSVTTGVISALHRSIHADERSYEDFIQTDAAINPGNSGGALLNIEGRLIGINTAIYGDSSGIGFAIPISRALAVVNEVMLYGEVRPVFTGLWIDRQSERGARILAVDPQSPAAEAGLRPGDAITDLGGQPVPDGRTFFLRARGLIPGQKVRVEALRAGAPLSVELSTRELSREQAAEIAGRRLGLTVETRAGGLVIARVVRGSDAERVGIRPGDLLLSLAGKRLGSLGALRDILAQLHDADIVPCIIGRRGRAYYVTLSLR